MSNGPARIATFAEFWPFYVSEHRQPLTRALHYVGTSLVIALFVTAMVTGRFWLLWLMPFAGYGFAWPAHFFVEKNRPATFTYPKWSLIADFVMLSKALRGQMASEVEAAVAAYPLPDRWES
jgi:hypothetical protein